MKIIGLTGPIAAGKDEVAKILKRNGACIIDADAVAHSLYACQSPIWHELIKAFGSKILNRGGSINRKKLAAIVFADKGALLKLDQIVHPHLKEKIVQIVEESKQKAESGEQKAEMIIINAAVLKEIGLLDYVDEVWVVLAAKENRIRRLRKTGITKIEALKRINSQAQLSTYRSIADKIIENNGTRKQLHAKLRAGL